MKTGSRLAFIVFVIVAFVHLVRLIFGWDVIIDGWPVPLWFSVLGVLGPGLIAWLLWKDSA